MSDHVKLPTPLSTSSSANRQKVETPPVVDHGAGVSGTSGFSPLLTKPKSAVPAEPVESYETSLPRSKAPKLQDALSDDWPRERSVHVTSVPILGEVVLGLRDRAAFPMHFERALDAASARHISLEDLLGRCAEGTVIVVPPLSSGDPRQYILMRRVGDAVVREPLHVSDGSVEDALAKACGDPYRVFQQSCMEENPMRWVGQQRSEYKNALEAWSVQGTEDVSRRGVGACVVNSCQGGNLKYTVMKGYDPKTGDLVIASEVVARQPGETLSDAMRRVSPRYYPARPIQGSLEKHGLRTAFEQSKTKLGSGAFGEVRLCLIDGKPYAIKVIYPTSESIKQAVADDEASLPPDAITDAMKSLAPESVGAQKLDGISGLAHVVGFEILNAEHVSTLDKAKMPAVYMAMPLAEHGTLKGQHKLTPGQAAVYGQQLFSKLAMIHGRGVAHRDINPENLGLNGSFQVCVLDMGVLYDFAKDQRPIRGLDGKSGYLSAWSLATPRDAALLPAEDVFAAAMTIGELAHCDRDDVKSKYDGEHNPVFALAAHEYHNSNWMDSTEKLLTQDKLRAFYEETITDGPGKFELIELLVSALDPDPRRRPSAVDMERELAKIAAFA